MSRNKDNNKKKVKRKKGKKFVYRNPTEEVVKKSNPFEDMSKKKLMKQGSKYDGVRNEYQTKNISNSFIDRRIGENSKNLTQEEKMKLRFKAQQMLNMKNKKDKFSLNNLDNDQDFLTHKGKKISESGNYSDDDFVQSDDEMYDKLDNYMNEIENAPDTKLSRKQIIQNIIDKSKQLKLEKQNQRRKNIEQIKLLDENFAELSELITRRPRTIGRLNDDFERMANSYNYLDKTKPTERIKSEKEIELEKENEIKKKLRQQIREDSDEENNEDENSDSNKNINSDDEEDLNQHPDKNADSDIKRPLTKKERIIKLMEKRLNKSTAKVDKDDIALLKKKRIRREKDEEDEESMENEDNLSDLDEFDNKNQKSKKRNLDEIEEEEKDYDEDSQEEDFEDEDFEDGDFDENDEFDEIAVKRNKIISERGDLNDNDDFEDDDEYSDDIESMKKNGEL